MDIVTEAAHCIWLQQKASVSDLQLHLNISTKNAERLLQRLAEFGVVTIDPDRPGHWLATPMPAHFFQKKGRSLYRRLTIYLRPKEGSEVVGVLEAQREFLTHQQQSDDWWLVCDHQGRIGYINVDALRFIHVD